MAEILIADDDPLMHQLLTLVMEERGHSMTFCSNGTQVLEKMATGRYDLALLDLNMPGRSGLSVCVELRRNPITADIPIIMVSGVATEDAILTSRRCGADDYLLKPLKTSELVAKVHAQLLDKPPPRNGYADLNAKYAMLELAGEGGFSNVYRAVCRDSNRDVAIKLYHANEQSQSWHRLFLRESYILSELQHPGIVGFRDCGWGTSQRYLVLDYIHGTLLSDLLQTRTLTEPELWHLFEGLSSVLDYLRQAGVVHRDVKPSNIIITDTAPVLIDFGQADFIHRTQTRYDDVRVGSPSFVSPEYAETGLCDADADVFALGITLFSAATGSPPAGRAISQSHVQDELLKRRPKLSDEFGRLVVQMLAPVPSERCAKVESTASDKPASPPKHEVPVSSQPSIALDKK